MKEPALNTGIAWAEDIRAPTTRMDGFINMARSTHIGIGIAATALASGVLIFGAMAHADSPVVDATPLSSTLVERVRCDRPTPASMSDESAGGTGQNLTVTVPATALLTLDNDGAVVAATTNTGCAPRSSDNLYLVMPDGSVTEATEPLPTHSWIGDFTSAGVVVSQRP
ncbi:MAG: hypothetical protein WD023_01015 [Ilumatobacteraceae bacterium]